jgi:hypothetical protein
MDIQATYLENRGKTEADKDFISVIQRKVPLLNLTFKGLCIIIILHYINPNKMHMLRSLFYLTTTLHVLGITITHLQEHKTTVTTASGNHYTVTDRVKFIDKEYRHRRLKLQLFLIMYILQKMQYVL